MTISNKVFFFEILFHEVLTVPQELFMQELAEVLSNFLKTAEMKFQQQMQEFWEEHKCVISEIGAQFQAHLLALKAFHKDEKHKPSKSSNSVIYFSYSNPPLWYYY